MKIILWRWLNWPAERGAEKIYLHAFTDGRDTPPRSAKGSLEAFEENLPHWAKAAWHLLLAATPWIAIIAGIVWNRPMT